MRDPDTGPVLALGVIATTLFVSSREGTVRADAHEEPSTEQPASEAIFCLGGNRVERPWAAGRESRRNNLERAKNSCGSVKPASGTGEWRAISQVSLRFPTPMRGLGDRRRGGGPLSVFLQKPRAKENMERN